MGSSALRSEGPAEIRPARIPAHGNGMLRPFSPGQSGNPSGKGGHYQEVQRICRQASPAAARRIVELMGSADERVALMAAEKVLERGWGKVKEMSEDAHVDPVADERRAHAKAEILAMLADMAKPEPLDRSEVNQSEPLPSRRDSGRPMLETEPPPPAKW